MDQQQAVEIKTSIITAVREGGVFSDPEQAQEILLEVNRDFAMLFGHLSLLHPLAQHPVAVRVTESMIDAIDDMSKAMLLFQLGPPGDNSVGG